MWKQDESETREGRRNVSKMFLQNDVDSWDPASEGGDETEIAQLAAFLEHRAAKDKTDNQTNQHICHLCCENGGVSIALWFLMHHSHGPVWLNGCSGSRGFVRPTHVRRHRTRHKHQTRCRGKESREFLAGTGTSFLTGGPNRHLGQGMTNFQSGSWIIK